MFTFSFSTAFAADAVTGTTPTDSQLLDKAYAEAKTNLATIKTTVVEKLAAQYTETIGCGDATHAHGATDNFITPVIAKSVYAQVAEKVYTDYYSFNIIFTSVRYVFTRK